ncbi:MAG: hypothetical protein AAB436_01895 [Patescibacteria group bacterium]
MTNKRLYFLLLGAVLLLFVGLVGGTYGTNKLLTTQAAKLTDLKAKAKASKQEQASLTKAKQEVKTYADLQKVTQAIVPEDKDQAAAVREIVNIAASKGISLASISFPSSTLGSGVTGAAAASSAAAATPTSTAAAATTAIPSQLQSVKNIPGVYQLLITVQGDSARPVRYSQFVSFLSALEHNRRTAQVGSITIAPKADDPGSLTFTLTLSEYIKP